MTDSPPLPTPTTSVAITPSRRLRWLAPAAGALVFVVLVVAVVALVSRGTAKASTPASAAAGYYAAVHRGDAKAAYQLLCPQRQQAQTENSYAAAVEQNRATGTGIRSWTQGGVSQQQGEEAIVPGTLILDNGSSTPIQILLLRSGKEWTVCSSNLGGILPAPGTGTGSSTSAA